MPQLDHYAGYVLAAFAITWLVFGAYLLYLRSRLIGLKRQLEARSPASGAPRSEPSRSRVQSAERSARN